MIPGAVGMSQRGAQMGTWTVNRQRTHVPGLFLHFIFTLGSTCCSEFSQVPHAHLVDLTVFFVSMDDT